jgi:hypothetical protein
LHTRRAVVFDSGAMGFGFWFKVLAVAVVAAIGAVLAIVLISSAFVKWGLFGGLLAIAVVLILIGWITDRRRRDDPYVAPPTGQGSSSATPRRGPFPPSGA